MLTLVSFSTFFFQFWLFNSIIDLLSAIEVFISFSSDFSVSGSVIFSGRRLWNMKSNRYWVLVAVDGYKNDIVHFSFSLRYGTTPRRLRYGTVRARLFSFSLLSYALERDVWLFAFHSFIMNMLKWIQQLWITQKILQITKDSTMEILTIYHTSKLSL